MTGRQLKVLRYARYHAVSFIDLELSEALGDQGSTYRTRRCELVAKGYLRDTGYRVNVPGHTKAFRLWGLTAKGAAYDLDGGI